MAIDFVPPAFVEEIGDANFRRFIYRDSIEQFFTGSSWTENLSGAALYHKESDAIAAQMQYSEGQRTYDTYTATIVVTTEKDAWALEDLLNLPNQCIYLKLMIDGVPSKPFSGNTISIDSLVPPRRASQSP